MKYTHSLLVLSMTAALIACGKKAEEAPAEPPAPAAETTPAQEPAPAPAVAEPEPATSVEQPAPPELTDEQIELAKKQAALDYATMEDGYINDPKGQWAIKAKASSSFGSANEEPEDSTASNTPFHATGAPNGDQWNNNSQDIGFDWIELTYEKPVKASEVRMVTSNTNSVESINKVELIDSDGTAHTIWSGVSDVKPDERGRRTWFVRNFEPTEYQVTGVKLTFANNVSSGYKQVDAVQLIGE